MRKPPRHTRRGRSPSPQSTAIVPLREGGHEIALPEARIEAMRGFVREARSKRTLHEYRRCWREFQAWCDRHGRDALPAGIDTIAAYISWLADGRGGTTPMLSMSTIRQAMSAVIFRHRSKGHSVDTGNPHLSELMKGIARKIAAERPIKRSRPLSEEDLRDILELVLRPDVLRDVCDAAVLAVAWGAARRESEVVGLDYQQHTTGTGILDITAQGVVIKLLVSKNYQEGGIPDVTIARAHAPLLCAKIEDWIAKSAPTPGEPVFRAIEGNGSWKRVKTVRMNIRAVEYIVKRCMRRLIRSRHKGRKRLSTQEVNAELTHYTGHSPRVGHITAAAERGTPAHHIQATSLHKSQTMIALYSRVVDQVKNSSLKGSKL